MAGEAGTNCGSVHRTRWFYMTWTKSFLSEDSLYRRTMLLSVFYDTYFTRHKPLVTAACSSQSLWTITSSDLVHRLTAFPSGSHFLWVATLSAIIDFRYCRSSFCSSTNDRTALIRLHVFILPLLDIVGNHRWFLVKLVIVSEADIDIATSDIIDNPCGRTHDKGLACIRYQCEFQRDYAKDRTEGHFGPSPPPMLCKIYVAAMS